jgi:hypothetical protein
MSNVTVPEQAVLSARYPAIDGLSQPAVSERIEEDRHRYAPRLATKPIRSDVQAILDMDEASFTAWYTERSRAQRTLLQLLTVAGDVPDLRYDSEEQKLTCGFAYLALRGSIEALQATQEYLELIKTVREQI